MLVQPNRKVADELRLVHVPKHRCSRNIFLHVVVDADAHLIHSRISRDPPHCMSNRQSVTNLSEMMVQCNPGIRVNRTSAPTLRQC